MRDDVKVLPPNGGGLFLEPCVVTQVTPLLVTLRGTSMPAVKINGATYALGAANALWSPPAAPIVLPIGA